MTSLNEPTACFTVEAQQRFQTYLNNESKNKTIFTASKRARYRPALSDPAFTPSSYDNGKKAKQAWANEKHDAIHNFCLIDNQLYYKHTGSNQPRIVACDYDAYMHIERIHIKLCHAGAEKTFIELRKHVYGISKEDVRWLKKRCVICSVNAKNQTRPPLEPIVACRALERIQLDLIDMTHEPSGPYKWILHNKDHFTKLSQLYSLKSKHGSGIADAVLLYLQHYRIPDISQCDNGREFHGALLILFKRTGIKVVNGLPRKPQTQGLVEQGNSVVKDKLRKWKMMTHSPLWHHGLFDVIRAINIQSHTSLPHGWSPYYAFFSREPKELRIDKSTVNKDSLEGLNAMEERIDELAAMPHMDNISEIEWVELAGEIAIEQAGIDMDDNELNMDNSGLGQASSLNEATNSPARAADLPILARFVPASPENHMQGATNEVTSPISSKHLDRSSTESIEDAIVVADQAIDSLSAGRRAYREEIHKQPILEIQAKRRETMRTRYNRIHNTRVFEAGDYVTLKIPREDRTSTDNLRIHARILEQAKPFRYKLQSQWGVLERLYTIQDLNPIPDENKATVEKLFTNAPSLEISVHKAAACASTSDRVAISCSCRKGCKNKRCVCIKNKVQCTQYCHGEDRCENASTIAEGTEPAIVRRRVFTSEHYDDNNDSDEQHSLLPVRSKRARASTTADEDTMKKRAKGKGKNRVEIDHQMTMSQFDSMAGITRKLGSLRQRE